MALSSPGVQVSVIDESFYTPAEPGTVPLIIVATAENKSNSAGTGISPGTLKANAGNVYLLTSQRDLAETFGDPVFKVDTGNNPIHAGEQNEYGLQAAYSLLGVSNRAYVVRADLDLDQLDATAEAPANNPVDGTYWFDVGNTSFGLFEWNSAPLSAGGQTFESKTPIVLTDASKVDSNTGLPKPSVGVIGDYAVVGTTNLVKMAYKNYKNEWTLLGSNEWAKSWPLVAGSKSNPAMIPGESFTINGVPVTAPTSDVQDLADVITNAGIQGISADVRDNKLFIYSDGTVDSSLDGSSLSNPVDIQAGNNDLIAGKVDASKLGIAAGVYYSSALAFQPHTLVPAWKSKDPAPRPSGSVWIKSTEPNAGMRIRFKQYNSTTGLWVDVSAPVHLKPEIAIEALDRSGGGLNIPVGSVYIKGNDAEHAGTDIDPPVGTLKAYVRANAGATTILSNKITASTLQAGNYSFVIAESDAGDSAIKPDVSITFTATGATEDAEKVAEAINGSGFENVVAEVDSLNRIVITHTQGGEMRIADGPEGALNDLGFSAFNQTTKSGTPNLYAAAAGDLDHDFVASNWQPLVNNYAIDDNEPTTLTADGQLWYSSIIDEVDLLVHNGDTWVGLQHPTSPYYTAVQNDQTDPEGPIVSATEPTEQSDGTALKEGDIWVSTADLENFPQIYRYNVDLLKWLPLDTSDQTTENGVLFADARWTATGINAGNEPSLITDMLVSDFIDFDAPDPALYPKGMILWNTRRSGFNVKQFQRNYVNTASDNIRYNSGESMDAYYPHRWVTYSPNRQDGAGSFGRIAQRSVVVKALQETVNSNQAIRDNESRIFNMMACPGYPELIGEMVSLNYDRGLSAFIVGDTPPRLTPDATSLNEWGNNVAGAVEDNDYGAVSFDEYMAMFYPWGFTSDNFGNNVVVPPSHMMLRTIALSDNVSYPWFAPAGIRRGGITNATAVGYVDDEGEFNTVALNEGQRDTLAGVKVNPLTFLTGSGLVNFGQYTRARGASALDRINVARLVIYLRSQLNKLAKPYIFEPNDKITRDEIKQAAESLLLELVGQRALYDFLVVCDESNNTPSRIDRNELYVDIAIEPVKAVEFIYIPLRLKNTGEIGGL
jgi:hypothetical protein